MRQLMLLFTLCAGLAIFGATAFSANDRAGNAPLLSRLAVGQHVRLETAPSGGYELFIFNERYLKRLQESGADFFPQKIIEVGPDFVVIDAERGIQRAIAAHAIDVVSLLPNDFGDAESRDSETSPEQ
ncbi:hypothetical protein FF011L_04220 [Roseimaritima multifibrata]|uniref:Uncharacterized protein n=1 Tax=Roseimaritima multifibrata TaxID=1930274 RepID=A0A517M9X9_9BACT|nr:hypothetical protein [Roseimaritima multifibrata]QDS91689.1 hypothetical protein FF011L_04220 [Roseimaritima multifibrata]